MHTTNRRTKGVKPLAEYGPLKVVPFSNPSGQIVYRVTGTVLGRTIKKNYPTFGEAMSNLQPIFHELTGGLTIEDISPTNLVRTSLTRELVTEAEEAFRRQKGTGLSLLDVQAIGLRQIRDQRAIRVNAKQYLIDGLKSFDFGKKAERKAGEPENEFAKRLKRTAHEQELLSKGSEAQLAAAHYACTLAARNVLEETVRTYRYVALKFVKSAAILTVAEITLEKLFAHITRKGVSSRTQKDQRARLFGFCAHLVKCKLLGENPVVHISPIRQKKSAIVYVKVAVMEKTLEIFSRCVPRGKHFARCAMLPRFLLTAFSPLRPEEIDRLSDDWSNFNLERGTVQIVRTKDGKENIEVTLDPRLAAAMRACVDRGLTPAFRRAAVWENWLLAGGVPKGVRDILRHSFASHWYAVDRNKFELAHRMNNSVEVLDRHYLNTSVVTADGKAYFALLERIDPLLSLPEVRYVTLDLALLSKPVYPRLPVVESANRY